VSVGTAGQGSAAGTSAPDLKFCLEYDNRSAYVSQPVMLYWFDFRTNKAMLWKSGRTAADGCGTFRDVVPNVYYAVVGQWSVRTGFSMEIWSGSTPWTWVGDGSDWLYTTPKGVVSRQ
jgi:hypothetical protein